MPLYDYTCDECGVTKEVLMYGGDPPACCGASMRRIYSIGNHITKWSPDLWVNRMDDIHKAQADRGERLRFVHPSEIL